MSMKLIQRRLLARVIFLLVLVALFLIVSKESVHAATLIKSPNAFVQLGWWRFDDESGSVALDSSGNNNRGSLYQMDETDWTSGVFGRALQFDNSAGEHVVVPHNVSLSPTTALTILGWAKPVTYGSGSATFVEKAYGTSYILYLDSSTEGMIFSVNGIDCTSNATIITLNTWQHIAATYNGTVVRFYVNGVERGTCSNVGSVGTDTSDVQIGNDDTLTTAFDGYLDDVRIYGQALTQNDILQIMRGDRIAKAAVTPEVAGTLATNLSGWWTFDGREVNWRTGVVTDKSGQGNTGTIVNMATTVAAVDGRLGQAFNFTGNGYVNIGNLSENAAGTISLWINPNVTINASNYNYGLLVNADPSVGPSLLMRWYEVTGDGALTFYIDDGGGWVGAKTITTNWKKDTWYHIVGSWGGGVMDITIDGIQEDSDAQDAASTNASTWRIGQSSLSTTPYYFDGKIDDVRFYSRKLSSAEIQKLHTMGRSTQNVSLLGANNLGSGLIGWWTMDGPDVNWGTGKVVDKSGSGNDGYAVSMSTTTSVESGKVGQSLLFDGDNDVVRTGSDFIGTNPVTISLWMNVRSFGEGNIARLVSNHAATGFFFRVFLTNNILQFSSNGGTSIAVSANNAVVLNKWIHAVVTRDASGVANIYVDGVLSGTADQNSGTPQVGSTNVVIGNDDVGTATFDGSIDDVRIYSRVLSASEVRQLYNGRR